MHLVQTVLACNVMPGLGDTFDMEETSSSFLSFFLSSPEEPIDPIRHPSAVHERANTVPTEYTCW